MEHTVTYCISDVIVDEYQNNDEHALPLKGDSYRGFTITNVTVLKDNWYEATLAIPDDLTNLDVITLQGMIKMLNVAAHYY